MREDQQQEAALGKLAEARLELADALLLKSAQASDERERAYQRFLQLEKELRDAQQAWSIACSKAQEALLRAARAVEDAHRPRAIG